MAGLVGLVPTLARADADAPGTIVCTGTAPGGKNQASPVDVTPTPYGDVTINRVKVAGMTLMNPQDYTVSGNGGAHPVVVFDVTPAANATVEIKGETTNSDNHTGGIRWT